MLARDGHRDGIETRRGHPARVRRGQLRAPGLPERRRRPGDRRPRAEAGSATSPAPVHVDAAPGFPRLLFVVEKPGRIAVLRDGKKLSRPFLDIRERVERRSGSAACCRWPSPRTTGSPGASTSTTRETTATTRWPSSSAPASTPTRAVASSRRRVLVIPHPDASNHNGGQLQFGPDGYLYIATGDGGSNATTAAATSMCCWGSCCGSIPASGTVVATRCPRGTPTWGVAGRNEIYAYGLRNPWRFSFDSASGPARDRRRGGGFPRGGRLRHPGRAPRGRTSAGRRWEGDQPHSGDPGPDPPTFPIFTYPHPDGLRGRRRLRGPRSRPAGPRRPLRLHGPLPRRHPQLRPQPRRGERRPEHRASASARPPRSARDARGRIYVASFSGGVFRLRPSG